MPKPFRRHLEAMPAKRREGIEAQTQDLQQVYELLKALRQERNVTQQQLADLLAIRQASVIKLEKQTDLRLNTLRKHVKALGGELEIRVCFPDQDVTLESGEPPA